jgi:hypothetical protein
MKRGPEDNNKDESSESDEITSMYISRHFSMERTDECKNTRIHQFIGNKTGKRWSVFISKT